MQGTSAERGNVTLLPGFDAADPSSGTRIFMNRRDYLRRSGLLLAGAAVAACNEQAPGIGGLPESQSESSFPDSEAMYDRGAPPIETSGWTAPTGVMPGYPVLGQELDADVVVVGAGLAGSSLALHLAETGVNVVVLEARQPGWGASGAMPDTCCRR